MKKIIMVDSDESTIQEVLSRILNGEKIVIFYWAQSNFTYPVFLYAKIIQNMDIRRNGNILTGFVSPILSYKNTFIANSMLDSINLAMKGGKKLYVLHASKINEIMNMSK